MLVGGGKSSRPPTLVISRLIEACKGLARAKYPGVARYGHPDVSLPPDHDAVSSGGHDERTNAYIRDVCSSFHLYHPDRTPIRAHERTSAVVCRPFRLQVHATKTSPSSTKPPTSRTYTRRHTTGQPYREVARGSRDFTPPRARYSRRHRAAANCSRSAIAPCRDQRKAEKRKDVQRRRNSGPWFGYLVLGGDRAGTYLQAVVCGP